MNYLRDRRVVLAMGGAFALVAAVGVALGIKAGDHGPTQPPPASKGGLIVDARTHDGAVDAARPLRCFVDGKLVGMATLADCARRNGVATNALDVGIDETGALAAANNAGPMITPLPPERAPGPQVQAAPAAAPSSACWRHSGDWRRMPADMTMNACVQTLFAGRCEKPGAASYGRWGEQTLRLVTGKVEISSDNRSFHTLVDQPAGGCSIPSLAG